MIDFVDKATNVAGTPINRANMMAIQGFHAQTTIFKDNGSIVQTNAAGNTLTTVFNSDGSITETFVADTRIITKTTKFNSDGSISEVMS